MYDVIYNVDWQIRLPIATCFLQEYYVYYEGKDGGDFVAEDNAFPLLRELHFYNR